MSYKNYQLMPRFQSQLQSSLDKSPFRHKKEAGGSNFKEKYFGERIENEKLLKQVQELQTRVDSLEQENLALQTQLKHASSLANHQFDQVSISFRSPFL